MSESDQTGTTPRMKIESDGGLLTYRDEEGEIRPLGYLCHFEGRGVYDPALGKVDIATDQVGRHNKLLDRAMIRGLDQNCQVGQGTVFYVPCKRKDRSVRTWTGKLVGRLEPAGRDPELLTFVRKGRVYSGRMPRESDEEAIFFERVS